MSWTISGVFTWIATMAPSGLIAALNGIRDEFPDAAEAIDRVLARIADGLSPQEIAQAIIDLPESVVKALMGRFDSRFHPGDTA